MCHKKTGLQLWVYMRSSHHHNVHCGRWQCEGCDVQYRLWRDLSDPTYLGPRVADKIVVGLILMR